MCLLYAIEDPTEIVFDQGVTNMNDFLNKIKQFEQITNKHMTDIWRIKDLAF